MSEEFSKEIIDKLNYYVYRLIDPRNGETFYVGKGQGNRVFEHAKGNKSNNENEKISRINQIKSAGFEVAHVIHRHGMDEETAFEVEAALIDAYPGLTNIMGGHGSNARGTMHANEIIQLYAAEEANLDGVKALLINVNRTATESSLSLLYEATRYAWRLNKDKAKQADIILSIQQGIIKGVFVAEKWLEATSKNFPGRTDVPGRYGFTGNPADKARANQYIGKRIPDKYTKKGASNPIKYIW